MSFPLIQPRPHRAIYVLSVIFVTLFIMGFLWFIFFAVLTPARAGVLSSMSKYDVANSTYPNFTLADTFMNNLWTYFLVFVVFVLLYWVFIYSQRKGQVMYR